MQPSTTMTCSFNYSLKAMLRCTLWMLQASHIDGLREQKKRHTKKHDLT